MGNILLADSSASEQSIDMIIWLRIRLKRLLISHLIFANFPISVDFLEFYRIKMGQISLTDVPQPKDSPHARTSSAVRLKRLLISQPIFANFIISLDLSLIHRV